MPYHRLIASGIPNHFWLRGNNRRRLFSYPYEYVQLLWLMVYAAEDEACAVHSLVLEPNHIHILVTPPTAEGGSRFVQRFSQRQFASQLLKMATVLDA
jgi:putative transposase